MYQAKKSFIQCISAFFRADYFRIQVLEVTAWMFSNARLLVFAKAPQAGKVKTRLLPAISADQAADLQTRLIFDTLKLVHQNSLCQVQLWCSPSTDHPVFRTAKEKYPISLRLQVGSDLGLRMNNAISESLRYSNSVVLIGCDCPSLTSRDLAEVFSALEQGADIALGPAEDGGYVLVGMKQPIAELFCNMEWGTDRVLSETRSRIRRLGLQCFETKQQWDLDRPEDLERFKSISSSAILRSESEVSG